MMSTSKPSRSSVRAHTRLYTEASALPPISNLAIQYFVNIAIVVESPISRVVGTEKLKDLVVVVLQYLQVAIASPSLLPKACSIYESIVHQPAGVPS